MASPSSSVLDAVKRLLEEPQFQDVHFQCSDGVVVSSNRAFLAARCEYFEHLLFGSLKEASSSEVRLHASSEAFRHVLVFLHTGHFSSIDQESCWITLMEASSLAQQYMLSGLVQHVADRLSADLRPENLGLALSHALKNDLQAVIKSIWVALPRLLPRPFALDRSFSADAICFCLQHTAWMAAQASAGGAATAASSSSAAASAAVAASAGSNAGSILAAQGSNAAALAAEAASGMAAFTRASSANGASMGSSNQWSQGFAEGAAAAAAAAAASRAQYASGNRPDSSVAQESQAFAAVLEWMLQEVAGCPDCSECRQVVIKDGSSDNNTCRSSSFTGVPAEAGLQTCGHNSSSSMQRQEGGPTAAAAGGSSRRVSLDRSCSFSTAAAAGDASQPQHPAMARQQSIPQQQQPPAAAAAGMPGASSGAAGMFGGVVGRRLSSHSVRSSYDSSNGGMTEGEQQQDAATRSTRTSTSAAAAAAGGVLGGQVPRSAFAAAASGSILSSSRRSSSCNNAEAIPEAAAVYGNVAPSSTPSGTPAATLSSEDSQSGDDSSLLDAAAAAPAAELCDSPTKETQECGRSVGRIGGLAGCCADTTDAAPTDAAPEQQQQYSGCCCVGHQAMLLQMLAHLNWQLLEPKLLEKLEGLALLGPAALLDIYKAHQRCCHLSQWGHFPCLSPGVERGLRCYIAGGEQVLECESVSHLTATSNLSFTCGKHCWQFVVVVPCDLVWLGLSDGSLSPDVWGGKQPGGWFYGSNDALCHNKQSDRHAYTNHCGNGKWGECAVVDVCLDMDAREVWFGLDGGEPKLGFTGLPDRVYPAVSLRAPAQLLVRFRAASWLMAAE